MWTIEGGAGPAAPAAEDGDAAVADPDEIAFEETRGMTAEQILAAIVVGRGSPAPVLGDGFVAVRGCHGAIVIGAARIPFHEVDRILPWPVAAA